MVCIACGERILVYRSIPKELGALVLTLLLLALWVVEGLPVAFLPVLLGWGALLYLRRGGLLRLVRSSKSRKQSH